jgi:hypothetical protein
VAERLTPLLGRRSWEVCGQVRKTRLRIDTFAIPSQHTIHNKRVSQVMDARAHAPAYWFQP